MKNLKGIFAETTALLIYISIAYLIFGATGALIVSGLWLTAFIGVMAWCIRFLGFKKTMDMMWDVMANSYYLNLFKKLA
jgi:hypothetical protein